MAKAPKTEGAPAPKAAPKAEKAPKVVAKGSPVVAAEMGVENTKEAVQAMAYVMKLMMVQFKDGIDWMDVPKLMAKLAVDNEFKESMALALAGRDLIDDEIKNIDIPEAVELGMMLLNEFKGIAAAMK